MRQLQLKQWLLLTGVTVVPHNNTGWEAKMAHSSKNAPPATLYIC
jgi:hypothetical protein